MEYGHTPAVNSSEKKKSFAFLLGAGCEGDGQLGLASGKTFKRDTIIAPQITNLIYMLNQKTAPYIQNGPLLTHNSYGVLTQTIMELGLNKFSFSKNEKRIIEDYIQIDQGTSTLTDEEKKQVRADYKKLYREKFYTAIKKEKTPVSDLEANVQYFLDHACFYSFVDSLFNHLRKPNVNRKAVNRVIKLYYAAYQSILFGLLDEKEYESILKTKASITEKRHMLDELLRDAQQRIMRDARENKALYYNQIADFAKAYPNAVSITTTNYTAFAGGLTGISGENMAYVHGRLDLFEDLNTKRIGSLTDFDEEDFIFPFIFVQSGVKPIVNGYEIHEFEKAANMIAKSDELIILGYGINSDDEHITNLIRSRLRSGKRVFCVLYEDNDDNRKAVVKELCSHDNILFKNTTEFEDLLASLA